MTNTNTKYIIRVVVVGAVSTGKSTLINSIFTNKYSDTKIKRTTMIPQVYLETTNETNLVDSSIINSRNTTINENILNNAVPLTKENCIEMTHLVPQIKDLINLQDNVFLEFYDLPGLDDSQQEAIYFDYLKDNFEKFDLVIFNIDINEALNTSGSTRILNEIIENVENSKHKKYLLVVVNKCDNMNIDIYDELQLDDEEQQEMYEQITNTLQTKIKFTSDKLEMKITKISALDSYIYRMLYKNPDVELDAKDLDKFGINEIGKTKWKKMTYSEKKLFIKETINDNYIDNLNTSGFNDFKKKFNTLLSYKNQYYLYFNRLMTDINNLNKVILDINIREKDIKNNSHIVEIINIINTLYKRYIKLNNIYKNTPNSRYNSKIIKTDLYNQLKCLIVEYLDAFYTYYKYSNIQEILKEEPVEEIEKITKIFKFINKKLYCKFKINNNTLNDIVKVNINRIKQLLSDLCNLLNEKVIIEKLVDKNNINQLYVNEYYIGAFYNIKKYIKNFYTNIKYYINKSDNLDNLNNLEDKLIQIICDNILLYTPKILKNTTDINTNLPVYSLVKYIKTFTHRGNDIIKKFYQKWLSKKYIDTEINSAQYIRYIHSNTFKYLSLDDKQIDDLFKQTPTRNTILYYTNIIHYQECSSLYEKYKDNEFMSIYILNNEINKNHSHYGFSSHFSAIQNTIQTLPQSKIIFDLRYSDFIKNKSYLIEEVEYYFKNF